MRLLLLLAGVALALALGGCGGGGEGQREAQVDAKPLGNFGATNEFPVPAEIKPNVDFWRHVYGVWSRGQVAFHDDEHMGLIYEVAQVPGAVQEGNTSYQKNWVADRLAMHKSKVRGLEQRLAANQPLSAEDKALLAKFEQHGGRQAVYGASERVRGQRGLRERFRRGLEISGRYDRAFREAMKAKGVPEDLAYLPHVESSFQTNARSTVGAAGVWQFMPTTGRLFDMEVNNTLDERLDPIVCAGGAAEYLSQAHDKLGSWPLAITSYNHGVGGMAKAKATYGNDIGKIVKNYNGKAFKFASRNFYSEFVAAREVARNAPRYFPEGVRYESPWPHDRVVLRDAMPAHHVASHYGVPTASLASLNLHFRDGATSGRAHLPAGTTVWVPAGSTRRVASHPPAYRGSAPAMVARAESRPTERDLTDTLGITTIKAVPTRGAQPRPARPEALASTAVARGDKATKGGKPITGTRIAKTTKVAAGDKPAKVAKNAAPEKAAKLAKNTKPEKAGKDTKVAEKSKAGSTAKSAKLAKASKGKTPDKVAKAESAKAASKVHTVKSKETLYRVATINGISVDQLRKLNKIKPTDNSIRPGQKLKVGI